MVDVLPRPRSRTLTVVLLAGVLPWLATLAALVLFGNAEHVNEPLHASLEVAGACIALAVALLLSLRSAHEGVDGPTLAIVAALVTMGILDGAHGLTPAGSAWSWLRHFSTLSGGLLVALVWLPLPDGIRQRRRTVIISAAATAAALAAAVLWRPDVLPTPWHADDYTLPVQLVNFIGGLGFLAAAAYFLRKGAGGGSESVLFASLTMLFGAASVLFGLSERWGAEWWTWHAIRIAAFIVVVVMAWRVLVGLYRRVEDNARELAAANRALAAEIAERRRTEADLEAHRARLVAEAELRESRRKYQAQATELAEANRLKDEFLSTLSHELRTPLSAILGWGWMLQKGGLDKTASQSAYDAIVRNALAQRQLIDDTLDVARIVTGRLRIEVQKIDLREAVAAVLDTVRPTAEAKGIAMALEVEAALPALSADPARLRQMLWNLLSNAVKFTPQGGRVTVWARQLESHVEVGVCDTGIGISHDFLPHVFERFSQADGSTARRHGGLGLGLAIVRHLAELHGATVEAESAGEGRGSTFRIRFPSQPAPSMAQGPTVSANRPVAESAATDVASLSGTDVLLVDDDAEARRVQAAGLRSFGAQVTAAASAAEGLAALRRAHFDVLVADIGMPGEDGYSFIRQVRALPAESGGAVPALALTAYARDQDRGAALAAGYQQHLSKPATPDVLGRTVAALLGRQAVSQA